MLLSLPSTYYCGVSTSEFFPRRLLFCLVWCSNCSMVRLCLGFGIWWGI